MSKHSAIVGGSTAGRLLNCPASLSRTRALPETADLPSEYAEEGTFAHAVMDALMRERNEGRDVRSGLPPLLGRRFHDRAVTGEHIDTLIVPALQQLDTLESVHDGYFSVVGVEQRVRFPGIPGAFGTVDLILQSDTHVLLCDWKFGQGVGVRAVTGYDRGDLVNSQLLYYAAAALRTHPRLFTRRRIVVAIVQPRGLEPLTFTEVSRGELRQFVEDMHAAVLAAVDRDPPLRRGEHCRFAPCKVACPLWTGPLIDLAALQPVAQVVPVRRETTPYGEYLARAKALVDSAVMLKAELDAQMHAYLENGGVIPGWRLKDKATRRQWVDPGTVELELRDLGFDTDDIWRTELVTFAQADATAKRLGVKIPDALRVTPPPSGTTLATTDDPAPVVEPAALVEKFTASLRLLQQGPK